ncbi:MAG: mannose-1-phosphate guanylyltransferase/mannose-6-phosphate isomerase [Methylovulum sp.]|nr:mannose-1-phosphate guanylyltransferase/mannose-6-phosphate isomerase [Methylovulum sp.]
MTTPHLPLIPVILSGGAGTRLWPISREGHPKPFMKLQDNQSLIEKTYRRALALANVDAVLTVTKRDYYFACRDELSRASDGKAKGAYLLEPFGKNTAPAIALSALYVAEHFGDDALLLVLASDHLIQNQLAFGNAVNTAATLAQQGYLVTFGITPTGPETGFGYIEAGAPIDGLGYNVQRFVEKPTLSVAEQYLAEGNYSWNSGMFCFTAASLLAEMELYAPDILSMAKDCYTATKSQWNSTLNCAELNEEIFQQFKDLSIDYALMEKSQRVAVVQAPFDWSDIGSWDAVANLLPADTDGNRITGDVAAIDVNNSYIHSETRVVGAIGVENLVIVDTPDALLIACKDRVQDVKQIVAQLKADGHHAATTHRTVFRPWGSYTVLEEGERFKIKRLEVNRGSSLSLQMHYHRSEHWVVVSGMAKVVLGQREFLLNTNESTFIPAGHCHRLENPGIMTLVMIEVQSGEYVGEDDIVRFHDDYGRV